jgi:hypothetical protein
MERRGEKRIGRKRQITRGDTKNRRKKRERMRERKEKQERDREGIAIEEKKKTMIRETGKDKV